LARVFSTQHLPFQLQRLGHPIIGLGIAQDGRAAQQTGAQLRIKDQRSRAVRGFDLAQPDQRLGPFGVVSISAFEHAQHEL
jgi:hypothetical protein